MVFQNLVLLEGRLTSDIELKETSNGKKYAKFSLCYNQPKKLDYPNEKGYMYDYEPYFFNCIAWNKTAEKISLLKKGNLISLSGKLIFNQWEDNNNVKRTNVSILTYSIKHIEMLKNSNNLPNLQNEDIPF